MWLSKRDDLSESASRPTRRADHLVRALAGEILDGTRPVGTLLPSESELAAHHGASVAAVRNALRRLEALGLIARSRGSLPRVVSGEVRAAYQIAGTARAGDYASPTQLVIERQRRVTAETELVVLLGVREGSDWLQLSGQRLPDEGGFGALAWVDIWLDVPDDSVAPDRIGDPDGIAALTGGGIAEVIETFAAASLTPAQARHLRARSGTACLHVTRRYLRGNGTLAAAVRDIHPAERVSVTLRLKPD